MKYLFLTISIFFLSLTKNQAQNFFKNKNPVITWNSGDKIIKSNKLKNGGVLIVKFDRYYVNINVVYGSRGYTVLGLEETKDWNKMQIVENDFDQDGINELVIAYGDGYSFKVSVYKLTKNNAIEIGDIQGGQFQCYFQRNKIILPFGSQGLFNEYTLTKGKFIQTVKD